MPLSTHPDDLLAAVLQLRGEMDGVNSQLAGVLGPKGWYFDFVSAKQTDFEEPPVKFSFHNTTVATTASSMIENNTSTPVAFTSVRPDLQELGKGFTWTTNQRTRFYYPQFIVDQGQFYMVNMTAVWNGSSVGHRELILKTYNSGDSQVAQVTDSVLGSSHLSVNNLTFPYRFNSSFHYFELVLKQDSGSSLGLNPIRISAQRMT